VPKDRIVAAEDLMQINLGSGLMLEVHHTPGHAPHHLSLLDRTNGLLIAGETAGVCIAGRVRPSTPPPFNLEEALSSIDRLIDLKPKRICYGHFGCYDDALERLKLIKQQLLTWNDSVKSDVEAGKKPEDILLTLREKDRSLAYLDLLDQDGHRRENALLINSIIGLSHSARKLG
jgi:glyoxylase-like metal-dependent hydrolase (beta-lactamase superfamily II)